MAGTHSPLAPCAQLKKKEDEKGEERGWCFCVMLVNPGDRWAATSLAWLLPLLIASDWHPDLPLLTYPPTPPHAYRYNVGGARRVICELGEDNKMLPPPKD